MCIVCVWVEGEQGGERLWWFSLPVGVHGGKCVPVNPLCSLYDPLERPPLCLCGIPIADSDTRGALNQSTVFQGEGCCCCEWGQLRPLKELVFAIDRLRLSIWSRFLMNNTTCFCTFCLIMVCLYPTKSRSRRSLALKSCCCVVEVISPSPDLLR